MAKRMFEVIKIEKLGYSGTCVCKKDNIQEAYTLRHTKLGVEIVVGNICGKMFTSLDDIDEAEIRSSLDDLRANKNAIPNLALIEYAQFAGFIQSDEEYDFLFCTFVFENSLSEYRKRELRDINRRILSRSIVRKDFRDRDVEEMENRIFNNP